MWSLQDAKARFSAVVDAALAGTPQEVSRRGRKAVVVVSAEEWERMSKAAVASGFVAHLAAIPKDGPETELFPRMQAKPRDIDF